MASFKDFGTIIVCLVTLKNVLQTLREITTKLQKRDLDIYKAYNSIDSVFSDMKTLRQDIDTRFNLWYTEIQHIAQALDVDERVPRAKGSNIHRATHPADSPKEYFKRALVIPFTDDVITQVGDRFPSNSTSVISALTSLIPSVFTKKPLEAIPELIAELARISATSHALTACPPSFKFGMGDG